MAEPRYVPAWQIQAPGSSYSLEDYVFILTEERDERGFLRVQLVHRLTPVDRLRQEWLRQIEYKPLEVSDGG